MTDNTVGLNGSGDGRPGSDGPYEKTYCQDEGAVYITAGSSGKKSGGDLDHEAMFISVSELGSCLMEIDSNQIMFKFIRESGLIQDSFSIIKIDCDTTQTTFCTSISTSYGDVEQRLDSTIYQQSSDLELARDNASGLQQIGLIFEEVDIRRGSSIASAYIQFMADDDQSDTSSDVSSLRIEGFLVDDAGLFTEQLGDVSSRPATDQHVIWAPQPWLIPNERTTKQRTPDISLIMQEIINQPTFRRGNNIGIRITGIGKRSAASFDAGNSGLPPELCITYVDCLPELDVHTEVFNTTTYTAEQSVISDAIFNAGPPVKFSAKDEVVLHPNFEIILGRIFTVAMLGCIIY